MKENENQETDFTTKAMILGELWSMYRDDVEFADFIEYNDLGLPLAYLIAEGIVDKPTAIAKRYVEETWALLLTAIEVEDTGYESLDDLLGSAK